MNRRLGKRRHRDALWWRRCDASGNVLPGNLAFHQKSVYILLPEHRIAGIERMKNTAAIDRYCFRIWYKPAHGDDNEVFSSAGIEQVVFTKCSKHRCVSESSRDK